MSRHIFILGFIFGIFTQAGFDYVTKQFNPTPKYQIGDCLSNGAYLELIVDIKRPTVLKDIQYIKVPIFNGGRRGLPSSSSVWLTDDTDVKVNNKNCEPNKTIG